MKQARLFIILLAWCTVAAGQDAALTIYNQNFAVVRQNLKLNLTPGVNTVRVSDITGQVEPESVVLRDPQGKYRLMILEQNYQSDPVSQDALLQKYEGQTIDFLVQRGERTETVKGTIVRAGWLPTGPNQGYGYPYYGQYNSRAMRASRLVPPIIQVEGQLRFSLPGTPLFPALTAGSTLKPAFDWKIQSDAAGPLNAELSYVTGGMNWRADYNVVAPGDSGILDLTGWVTMENDSGRTFEDAGIKLMAGDVSKVQPPGPFGGGVAGGMASGAGGGVWRPPVTEKTFDEYHLYTLERRVTLRDGETKQVEFLRAPTVKSQSIYVYDGLKLNLNPNTSYQPEYFRQNREWGSDFQPKVWVMREMVNSKANGLGMPLPKGRVRFYRRDTDARLEFIGENNIDHTPTDETLRIYTGNAFDLTGERVRTNFRVDSMQGFIDESFEIRLRNHKKEPVTITVVEHLFRGAGWAITSNSQPFKKVSAQQIEFEVQVPAGGQQMVTYAVHYTW